MNDSSSHDSYENIPRRMGNLRGRSLLAVFAHPDDESLAAGGLLSLCAALGVNVTLVCATRGEHGPGHGGTDFGAVRTVELQAAARILGITDVIWLDHEDGMLPWLEGNQLETDIREAIRRVQPDVVITFGADGLYWHPDHITIHEATTAVVAALGQEAPALYYVILPAADMQAIFDHAVGMAGEDRSLPQQILGVTDVAAFSALPASQALIVDIRHYAFQKLAALRCHVTQIKDSVLTYIEDRDAPRLLGFEYYQRADVGARNDTFMEHLEA